MSTDGSDEAEFIAGPDGIGTLLEGRVWEIRVPPNEKIPKGKPYAILSFGEPSRLPNAASLADSEATRPHLLPITVTLYATTVPTFKAARRAIRNRMVSLVPSTTGNAGEIQASGGSTIPRTNDEGAVELIIGVMYFRVVLGVSA